MSGSQQLMPALTEAVNVGGTQAVLHAALAAGVGRLVYLSTYNVVYGGQRIEASMARTASAAPQLAAPASEGRSRWLGS